MVGKLMLSRKLAILIYSHQVKVEFEVCFFLFIWISSLLPSLIFLGKILHFDLEAHGIFIPLTWKTLLVFNKKSCSTHLFILVTFFGAPPVVVTQGFFQNMALTLGNLYEFLTYRKTNGWKPRINGLGQCLSLSKGPFFWVNHVSFRGLKMNPLETPNMYPESPRELNLLIQWANLFWSVQALYVCFFHVMIQQKS